MIGRVVQPLVPVLGVLTPQLETLERVLRAAEDDALPPPQHELDDEELKTLLLGLHARAA